MEKSQNFNKFQNNKFNKFKNNKHQDNKFNKHQDNKFNKHQDNKIQKIPWIFPKDHINTLIECDILTISNNIPHHDLEDFIKIKDKLNKEKNKIDGIYLDEKQSLKYQQLNGKLNIHQQLRKQIQTEMNGQLVTRAWLKLYEIFKQYDLIEDIIKKQSSLTAFMNAELPGAAICALNHIMKTMYKNVEFNWYGSSIVLDYSTEKKVNAFGDKYGLWEKNKDNWLMTTDIKQKIDTSNNDFLKNQKVKPGNPDYINNGDATILNNLIDYNLKLKNSIDLYTHDAGIDVSEKDSSSEEQTGFNLQEYKNMKIHFGCALAAFMTMKKGAHFVAKQYTFFETFTIDLIMIYASMFKEFYICKPMTSGSSNSEIYLIGKSFNGMPKEYEKILIERLVNFNTHPFISKENKPACLKQILKSARIIFNQQIEYISQILSLYKQYGDKQYIISPGIKWALDEFANIWLKKYEILPIELSDYLPSIKKNNEYH